MINDLREHITKGLLKYSNKENKEFDLIFNQITASRKNACRQYLNYINKVLDNLMSREDNELEFVHIHIAGFGKYREIILEFLLVKMFITIALKEKNFDSEHSYIKRFNIAANRILGRPIQAPMGRNKRAFEKKKKYRKDLLRIQKQLNQLYSDGFDENIKNYSPVNLFQLLVKDYKSLVNSFKPTVFFLDNSDISQQGELPLLSYNFLNYETSLDDLDNIEYKGNSFAENLENILLFDSVRKQSNSQFSFSNLNAWNKEGLNIKNLILFTFDKKSFRLSRLLSQLNQTASRYHFRLSGLNYSSFVIAQEEIETLIHNRRRYPISINFLGNDNIAWPTFRTIINEYEFLGELTSMKLRNIYSVCFNNRIKEALLTELFHQSNSCSLLSAETLNSLRSLSSEDSNRIQQSLELILDSIISLNIPTELNSHFRGELEKVLVSSYVFEDKKYKSFLQEIFPDSELITWNELSEQNNGNIAILDYRDTGRYPFSIYPNIIETDFARGVQAKGIFITFLFKQNFDYISYNYFKTYYSKLLNHEIRKEYLNWAQLSEFIEASKPDYTSFDLNLDVDNSYASFSEKESIKIRYGSNTNRNFYPAQLFLASIEGEQLLTLRADEIFDYDSDVKIQIQPYEEVYKNISLFENSPKENEELKSLRKRYDLSESESDYRLWKILLKRKCDTLQPTIVYSRIKKLLEESGESIVSYNHFLNDWYNLKSLSLIPRSRKVFRIVCRFLGLSDVYYILMLKKRAAERKESRFVTSKMNNLVRNLVELGLLENPDNISINPEFYFSHELDELGFEESNFESELKVFANLLKEEMNLQTIHTSENINDDYNQTKLFI